jgi:hypothetical protein
VLLIWAAIFLAVRHQYDLRYFFASLGSSGGTGLVLWIGKHRQRLWRLLLAIGVVAATVGFFVSLLLVRQLNAPSGGGTGTPLTFLALTALGWALAYVLDAASWPASPVAVGHRASDP